MERDARTRECLLCLRIPLEGIRETVEAIFRRWIWHSNEYDQAVVDRVAERAAKLIASAYEKDRIALCGKSPTGLMAAAIYLSGRMEEGVKISQRMIRWAIKTTTVTIRKRAHQINDILDLGIIVHRPQSERRKLYVCPICEKTFTSLTQLMWHLHEVGWRNASNMLRVRMFNVEGVMIDRGLVEELKRLYGTCEKPPSRPRWRDWRESPVVGRYRITG